MTLRTLVFCAAALAPMVACDGGETDPALEHGESLYSTNCVACHGADGLGTGSGPDLTGYIASESDTTITTLIQGGREAMPAFDSLTEDDIADLIAYAKTL